MNHLKSEKKEEAQLANPARKSISFSENQKGPQKENFDNEKGNEIFCQCMPKSK